MRILSLISLFILFVTTQVNAQSFDIKFIVGPENEKPHLYNVTSDSTILVPTTLVDSTNSSGALQLLRLDLEGNILNTVNLNDSIFGVAYDAFQNEFGDVFFLMWEENQLTLDLFKFSYDFELLWKKTLSGGYFYPLGRIVPMDQSLLIVQSSGENRITLDYDGNIIDVQDIDSTNNRCQIWRAHKNDSGKVIIAGSTFISVAKNEAALCMINEDRSVDWEFSIVDSLSTKFLGLTTDLDGDIYVAGERTNTTEFERSAMLLKLSSQGELIFKKVFYDDAFLYGIDVLVHNDIIYLLCRTQSPMDILLLILDLEGNELSRHNLGDNRNSSSLKLELVNDDLYIIGYGVNEIPEVNMDIKFIVASDLETISSTNILKNKKVLQISPVPAILGASIKISEVVERGEVFNQNGVLLSVVTKSDVIDTGNLPAGIYYLKATTYDMQNVIKEIIILDK